MELFDIATEVEYIQGKAQSFDAVITEAACSSDSDVLHGVANMFRTLEEDLKRLSVAIYDEARAQAKE